MFVCFIRYGQTKLEAKEKEGFWNNSPLSKTGKKQVSSLIEAIQMRSRGIAWDVLISEDTQGAKETSFAIQMQIPMQQYFSPGLRAPRGEMVKKKQKAQDLQAVFEPMALMSACSSETEDEHLERVKIAFASILKRFSQSNIIVVTNEKTLSAISREFLHLSNVVWPSGCGRIMEFENGKYLKTIRKVI